jgi:hypothetical protein
MRNALSFTLIGPMTLSIMTLSIVAFNITKIKHDIQHYDSVIYVEYLK